MSTTRTLLMIEADEFALGALLCDVGGDVSDEEVAAAVDAWFAELGQERERKLDGYGEFIYEMELRVKAKKERAAQLTARAKTEEARVRYMKDRVLSYLLERGERKVAGPLHTFSVQANGGVTPLVLTVEPENLPSKWRDVVVTYQARTDEIRRALESGDVLPFATIGQRGVHLRIR